MFICGFALPIKSNPIENLIGIPSGIPVEFQLGFHWDQLGCHREKMTGIPGGIPAYPTCDLSIIPAVNSNGISPGESDENPTEIRGISLGSHKIPEESQLRISLGIQRDCPSGIPMNFKLPSEIPVVARSCLQSLIVCKIKGPQIWHNC